MQGYLSKLLEPKANGPEATIMFVSLLGVNISNTTLTKEVEEHPDYPSLLSISDVLNSYGIENMGIKLDRDKFAEIPVPFIAQLKGVNSATNFFTVVKEIRDDVFCFFDPEKHRWSSLASEDFLQRSSQIVLLAEPNEDAGEKNYELITRLERRTAIHHSLIACLIPALVITAGITGIIEHGQYSLFPFIFSVLTLFGGIISALLIWYEIDQHNPLLQQICKAGKKVSCGAVLHSKAAKIAGISWSAIGFSYFMGLLFLLVFRGLSNPVTLFVMAWITFAAVPYVIYSIYYQWLIVKQWCVMCLFVQAILLTQFFIAFFGKWHTLSNLSVITPELVLQILFAVAIPFVLTAVALPILKKAKENKDTNVSLQKLKHNKQVFEALLQKQKVMLENPSGLGITLGNPNGSYKLIKVCNPFCGPCAKAQHPIEHLLHSNPELQVQILFTATNNEEDVRTPPVRHLLAVAMSGNEITLKQALNDWYLPEKKDYRLFAGKYPMNGELKKQDLKIEAMQNWCEKVKIEFTPTFFISLPDDENGEPGAYHQLPDFYSVEDLKYFFSV